jgi:hypothetical protein
MYEFVKKEVGNHPSIWLAIQVFDFLSDFDVDRFSSAAPSLLIAPESMHNDNYPNHPIVTSVIFIIIFSCFVGSSICLLHRLGKFSCWAIV